MAYDRDGWEERWKRTLREHKDMVARRRPSAHLIAAMSDIPPGRVLDAGCGHGAESLWLARQGWQVTGVDFAISALEHARSKAVEEGLAERVTWILGDLATWVPDPGQLDAVVCLYVHIAGSVEELVRRLASGVKRGGVLLLVGHRPLDPLTGQPTPAAGQIQVSVEGALVALDPLEWEILIAEDRPRHVAETGVDAVIFARRRLTNGV